MNGKIKASVCILTFNSAGTLSRALNSVKDFEEVIICDGGSTDETLDIARRYSCRIINQDRRCKDDDNAIKDFSCARNQCLAGSSFDWFLYIDSDEATSPELVADIRRIAEDDSETYVYNIPVRIFIGDKLIKYSSNYPGYQNRFFSKKSGARFVKPVHERIEYDRAKFPTTLLMSPWYVFMTEDEARHYLKHNIKYARREALRNVDISFIGYLKWIVYGSFKTILKINIKMLRNYVLHGFRDTMPFSVEYGRIAYALAVFLLVTGIKLKKIFL